MDVLISVPQLKTGRLSSPCHPRESRFGLNI